MMTKKQIFELVIETIKTIKTTSQRPILCMNIPIKCTDCPYITFRFTNTRFTNTFSLRKSEDIKCNSKFKYDFNLYTKLNAWNKLKCTPKKIYLNA